MSITEALALDCEMVGAGPRGNISMVARVSIVNEYEQCIYDKYVQPRYQVTDYRTPFSGITKMHLFGAPPCDQVKREVAALIRKRILVGHDVEKDLRALGLCHPDWNIRDTSSYFRMRHKPSLKYLARRYLGRNIQQGPHSSAEDARATMALYKMFEDEWEASDSSEDDSEEYDEY